MNRTNKSARISVKNVFNVSDDRKSDRSSPETVKSDHSIPDTSDKDVSSEIKIRMNKIDKEALKRVSIKPKDTAAQTEEYNLYQKEIQSQIQEFIKSDDFSRYLNLGAEFIEAPIYSSRKKTKDLLGFEYSIPPKEKTLSAKMKGKLAEWVAEEAKLQEEELAINHFLSGNTLPFRIDDLKYDVEKQEDVDYDTYYQKIKELSYTEKQLDEKQQNVANSALITGGNVAYGKAISDEEGNFDFEKKVSVDSDDDMEFVAESRKKSLRVKLADIFLRAHKSDESKESEDYDSGEKSGRRSRSRYFSSIARRRHNTRS